MTYVLRLLWHRKFREAWRHVRAWFRWTRCLTGDEQDRFFVSNGDETELVPPCRCWTQTPRWTVSRWFRLWWRCGDCGRWLRWATWRGD